MNEGFYPSWAGNSAGDLISGWRNPLSATCAQVVAVNLVWVAIICAWAGVYSPVAAQVQHTYSHPAMGVEFRIAIHARDEKVAREALRHVVSTIDGVDAALSDYKSSSELKRVMQSADAGNWIEITPMFYDAVRDALRFSQETDGAFDITVGPVSRLWRSAIKRHRLPDDEDVAKARERVGYRFVELSHDTNSHRIRFLTAGMQLDFGAIGKGWAADRAIEAANIDGVMGLLIDAAGDIVTWGKPIDRDQWRVALPQYGEFPAQEFSLGQMAIATSGDWYQSLRVGGRTYSHIVDPRTGYAVTHSSRVTVIARDGATADAWATALSVLSPDEALAVAECRDEIEASIVSRDHQGQYTERKTKGFGKYVPDQ